MSDKTPREYEFDAFLSHNSVEKDAVELIARRLEGLEKPIVTWLDRWELIPGQSSVDGIERGIQQSRTIVLFLGPGGFGPWHQLERRAGLYHERDSRGEVTIIPVLLPGIDEPKEIIPLLHRDPTWVVFKSIDPLDEDALNLMICGIRGEKPKDFLLHRQALEVTDKYEPIVPQGLRSFTEKHSGFFLRLLPGPRENGLPTSVSFWKCKFEEVDPEKTFRVGLLHGPSGCGKSSLMKAGVLTRLAEYVRAIYLEASPEDTEDLLLVKLRRQFPALPQDLDLPTTLQTLQQQPQLADGCKVVLILDQFEQRLHAKRIETTSPLVQALRCCDGRVLQALIMVRVDFWLQTHRFFQLLEGEQMKEGDNMQLVDLLGLDHAKYVLSEFGRAYGRFANSQKLTDDENAFLNGTLQQLQDKDERFTAIQLALFADLVKEKSWTEATLTKQGGTKGVGRTFLKENFDAQTANPRYRANRHGAIVILNALLPLRGGEIKGTSRTTSELMLAAGYQTKQVEFDDLLRILVEDLKLVSLVASDETTDGLTIDARYELTHDYLVPSLREWLDEKTLEPFRKLDAEFGQSQGDQDSLRNRATIVILLRKLLTSNDADGCPVAVTSKLLCDQIGRFGRQRVTPMLKKLELYGIVRCDEPTTSFEIASKDLVEPLRDWTNSRLLETWQGRTQLLLEERSAQFQRDGENPRHFPSLWELLQIQRGVPRRQRPDSQRFLRKAYRHHIVRTGGGTAAVIFVTILIWLGKDYCTFQAEFAPLDDGNQRQEIIITRKFDPLAQFRQGTWIFKDELRDLAASNQILGRLNLNIGWTPDWSRLEPLLADSRVSIAELEWLERPVSKAETLLSDKDLVHWSKSAPKPMIDVLVSAIKDQDNSVRRIAMETLGELGKSDAIVIDTLVNAFKELEMTNVTLGQDRSGNNIAAEALIKLGKRDPIAIEALIKLLKDHDRSVRYEAAHALVKVGTNDPNVIAAFVALTKDQDGYARDLAVDTLRKLGDNGANVIATLVEMLKDQESWVRHSAVEALGELGKSDLYVLESVVALLKDQASHVRVEAARVLVGLGSSAPIVTDALLEVLSGDKDEWVRSEVAGALGKLGNCSSHVIDSLVAALNDESYSVRSEVTRTLGKLGNCDAMIVERLVAMLINQDCDVRHQAARALGELGNSDDSVIEALVSALKEGESLYLRNEAAEALGKLGDGSATVIDVLITALEYPAGFGRVTSFGLFPVGPPSSAEHLSVRCKAATALGELGNNDINVIRAIVTLLEDDDMILRGCAAESIGNLGKSDESVVKALVAVVEDKPFFGSRSEFNFVCIRAVQALGKLGNGDSSVIKKLVALLADQDSSIRDSAEEALMKLVENDSTVIDTLITLLRDENAGVRYGAAVALGKTDQNDAKAIETLSEMLKDNDKDVRFLAVVVATKLGRDNQNIQDALVSILKDQDRNLRFHAAAALGIRGNSDAKVITSLVALLKDQDPGVRSNAAWALGVLGENKSNVNEPLIKALKDPDSSVRARAAAAIGTLGQNCAEWTDEQMLSDLTSNDSCVRERAGIVLAYRRNKVDLELSPNELAYQKHLREQVEKLRNDSRPWVKQASLHALYHIEKRKAELAQVAPNRETETEVLEIRPIFK